jgi:hypothetical protein
MALGVASLTILPAKRADKSATTLYANSVSGLLKGREQHGQPWFVDDHPHWGRTCRKTLSASTTAMRNRNVVLKCWKENNLKPMEAS